MTPPVDALARKLAGLPGVVAVALGGSRATGDERPGSDWDLGVYYRGSFDPGAVGALGYEGTVSQLGEWGPVMNGGAWLTVDGLPVDVIYRDLEQVERWAGEAERGRFEVLLQAGYLAGAPTYLPMGELALCVPLVGELPRPSFPDALAAAAPERWRGRARLSLTFALQHDDPVARAGMLAHAVLCEAHARLAGRREWALNEKRLTVRAGLEAASALADVAAVAAALELEPLPIR